jgi:hypothetical protein
MIGTIQAVSVAAVKTLTNATLLLSRLQQFVAQTRADKERVDPSSFAAGITCHQRTMTIFRSCGDAISLALHQEEILE